MTAAAVPAVRVDAFGLTDPGKVRPANEDHFGIAILRKAVELRQCSITASQVTERYSSPEAMVFVVADGVGGQPGGAFASETAITTLVEYLSQAAGCYHNLDVTREHEFLAQLENSVQTAHQRLGGAEGKSHGPATTLTMATLVWPRAYIVHVGDSRAYLFRDETLRQLTQDHTVVAEMVRRGELDTDDARRHRMRHVITNVVGGSHAGVHADAHSLELHVGDELLLCSDGLTEMLSHEDMTQVLRSEPHLEAACRRLISLANERGGRDNITVIVARFSASPPATGEAAGPP